MFSSAWNNTTNMKTRNSHQNHNSVEQPTPRRASKRLRSTSNSEQPPPKKSSSAPIKHTRTKRRAQYPKHVSSQSTSSSSNARNSSNNEIIDENDTCPICQTLLYRPVTTQCNHTLCELCMTTWSSISISSTTMELIPLDSSPPSPLPPTSIEAKCPLCRTQTHATLNEALISTLAQKYPLTSTALEHEFLTSVPESSRPRTQLLVLDIGNRVSDTEWTFFITPHTASIVEEIHIHLPASGSSRQQRVIRSRPPYCVTRNTNTALESMTVNAYVLLRPGYSWVSDEAWDSPDGAEKGVWGVQWTLRSEGGMGRVRVRVRGGQGREGKVDGDGERREEETDWERFVASYVRDGGWEPPDEDV